MAALALGLTMAPREASADWLTGSFFTLVGTNTPDGFTGGVMLNPGMTFVDNGRVSLIQTIYTVGGGAQWLDLYFQTVGGGPLASAFSSGWGMQANGIQTSTPEYTIGLYLYFTSNGLAFNPISPLPNSNLGVEPNPINPSLGPVYGTTYNYLGPYTSFNFSVGYTPYSALANGGINPNTANGFHMALEVTPSLASPIPEPSSLCLALIGAAVVGGAAVVRAGRIRGNSPKSTKTYGSVSGAMSRGRPA
jgi:hypothetical protein